MLSGINWYKKLFVLAMVVCQLHAPDLLFAQHIFSININGGINPASAEYIHTSIEKAQASKAECLLIHLNTPGGLISSTRDIVSDMFKSTVPVVVYVSPPGAHAGSAGVFIMMAANIAAMAPGTNIGAAHPVSMQGTTDSVMNTKGTNDAAAFIQSIAEKRHRNPAWAQDAVRNSVSITEEDAIEKNVIDYIANDDKELLAQIDSKSVEVNGGTKILHTKNVVIESGEMGFFQKILNRLSDPNISYIIMMLGFFGLVFELFNPGSIFPGIAGVIFLVLAFYSMSSMPVSYAGLSLIIFGIILFLLEIKIASHGILTVGGIVSLLIGSLFLIRNSPVDNIVSVSKSIIFITTAIASLFFILIIVMAIKSQGAKPVTGARSLLGKKGFAMETMYTKGIVKINGELWKAIPLTENIHEGDAVTVKDMKDLTLYVEKI